MVDIIILGGLGSVGVAWAAVAIYSLFRPDKKPPIGTFESYIGRIGHMGEEQWGRLRLADGMMTFTPIGATDGVSVPMSEVTAAEFLWGSNRFTVWFGKQSWRFTCFKRQSFAHAGIAGRGGYNARNEWLRQMKAAGVRIEPEASWADERASRHDA